MEHQFFSKELQQCPLPSCGKLVRRDLMDRHMGIKTHVNYLAEEAKKREAIKNEAKRLQKLEAKAAAKAEEERLKKILEEEAQHRQKRIEEEAIRQRERALLNESAQRRRKEIEDDITGREREAALRQKRSEKDPVMGEGHLMFPGHLRRERIEEAMRERENSRDVVGRESEGNGVSSDFGQVNRKLEDRSEPFPPKAVSAPNRSHRHGEERCGGGLEAESQNKKAEDMAKLVTHVTCPHPSCEGKEIERRKLVSHYIFNHLGETHGLPLHEEAAELTDNRTIDDNYRRKEYTKMEERQSGGGIPEFANVEQEELWNSYARRISSQKDAFLQYQRRVHEANNIPNGRQETEPMELDCDDQVGDDDTSADVLPLDSFPQGEENPQFPVTVGCEGKDRTEQLKSANVRFDYREAEFDIHSRKSIVNILRDAENGKLEDRIMTLAPVGAKGGEIFLFRCNTESDESFLDDMYTGFNRNSDNSFGKELKKKTYFCKNAAGSRINFQKHVYRLQKEKVPKEKTSPVGNNLGERKPVRLIHYLGDESLWNARPHGNSKNLRDFTRTCRNTIQRIKDVLPLSEAKPSKIYSKVVGELSEKFEDELETREQTLIPRNAKQVENLRYSDRRKKRISTCEISSIFEMQANKTFGNFVLDFGMHTTEKGTCYTVVLGDPIAFKFGQKLLREAEKNPRLNQLLNYDTTFEMADAYVSMITMRNTYLKDDPVFPLCFLIHDSKEPISHLTLWRKVNDKIDLGALRTTTPLCVDREDGIRSSITKVIPDVKMVLCHNHLVRNVKRWVQQTPGSKPEDVRVYVHHLEELLESRSEKEYEALYEERSKLWSQPFKAYFDKEIAEDQKKSSKYYTDQFAAFSKCKATTNCGESLNRRAKDNQNNERLPVDTLILTLFKWQLDYLNEFSRAFKQTGNYNLKDDYKNTASPLDTAAYFHWDTMKMVEDIKSNNQGKTGPPVDSVTAKHILAEMCTLNELVKNTDPGIWTVRGPVNLEPEFVKKTDSGKYTCTCKNTGQCFHILSVLKMIKEHIPKEKKPLQLSKLLRVSRAKKGRSGKKGPEPRRSIDVIEAEDSALAGRKRKFKEFMKEDLDNSFLPKAAEAEHPLLVDDLSDCTPNCPSTPDFSSHNFKPNTPSAMCIENTPEVCNERMLTLLQQREYETLYANSWISDKVLDTMCIELIRAHKQEEVVGYWDNLQYKVMENAILENKKDFVQPIIYAKRMGALNRDQIFVGVTNKGGNHFMLGIICFRTKSITLMDSMKDAGSKQAKNRDHEFRVLTGIVECAYAVANNKFDPSQWTHIYSNGTPQQKNGVDCGPFVILNVYSILRRTGFTPPSVRDNSKLIRRWILHTISNIDDNELARRSLILPGNMNDQMNTHYTNQAKKLCSRIGIKRNTKITPFHESNLDDIITDFRENSIGWDHCAMTDCEGDIGSGNSMRETQLLCVACRQWFHKICVQEEAEIEYYNCFKCRDVVIH